VPEAWPWTDVLPGISAIGGTSIGSAEAPITISLPRGARPPITALMACALVTVARVADAPPSFWSSCAASCAVLSM